MLTPHPGLRGGGPRTCILEEDMWECRLLGAHTPFVLLNTLFYFNVKLFKLTVGRLVYGRGGCSG